MILPSGAATQFDPAAAEQMEKIICDLGRMYHERNEALQEVARAHHESLFLLAMAAEYKDDDTGVHIVRIGFLAEALALYLGQSRSYALLLRKAAPMHDVGKIGIPDAVLCKPGRLTNDEYTFIKVHPERSYEILRHVDRLKGALAGARHHQEKFDGTGYPHGLRGSDIPLLARIIAVADTYDSITSSRAYRAGSTHEAAEREMRRVSGTQLDPELLDIFLRLCDDEPAMLLKMGIRRECDDH